MSIPEKHEVQAALRGLDAKLVELIHAAWEDWRSSPHVATWRCKRSRASFMWEQMIHRAHLEFDTVEEIRIIEGHETYNFLARDKVLFRFKKGDESGLTSNIPTQLAMAFHDPQQELYGLPNIHRVEIVYKPNNLETAIDDVLVVARKGKNVTWTYSLMGAGADILPLPTKVAAQSASSAAQLVRPREITPGKDHKKSDK